MLETRDSDFRFRPKADICLRKKTPPSRAGFSGGLTGFATGQVVLRRSSQSRRSHYRPPAALDGGSRATVGVHILESSSNWQTNSRNPCPLENSPWHKGPFLPLIRTSSPAKNRALVSISSTSKVSLARIATGITPCPLMLKQFESLPGLMSISTVVSLHLPAVPAEVLLAARRISLRPCPSQRQSTKHP